MSLISELFPRGSVAEALVVLTLIGALGLWIGRLKLGSVRVGVIGVLAAGLLFGHLGVHLHEEVLHFVREFGLLLFVYTIGMQVGPGFAASLRKQGLVLSGLAVLVVLGGVLITFGIAMSGQVPPMVAVGLYSGAVTNTPGLGAAQQALKDLPLLADQLTQPGVGYALAYPFGILGTILAMVAIRLGFRIRTSEEAREFAEHQAHGRPLLSTMNLEVSNPNLDGMHLLEIPTLNSSGVVVSRVWHDNTLQVATAKTLIRQGDVLLAVGPVAALDALRLIVGKESAVDLRELSSDLEVRRALVSRADKVNVSLEELNFSHRYGVAVTRVLRGEVELAASPGLELSYGDILVLVGKSDALDHAAAELGNQPKQLHQPPILPIFVGLVFGIVLGSIPFQVPGFSAPLKLGLAGGPLLAAMILAWSGRVGPLVWYLPGGANFTLREVGIVLFLGCVGLKAGDGFVPTLLGGGWVWMFWGALITVVPLLLAGILARAVFKLNYLTICGLLAGSHTDPPALAFAGAMSSSDAPAISYATIYPLVMLLRVLSAQVLVFILAGRLG